MLVKKEGVDKKGVIKITMDKQGAGVDKRGKKEEERSDIE